MTDDRMGGIALIAAAVGGLVTMSIHPTGADLAGPGQHMLMAFMGIAAHTLALATMPVGFLGALALTRRLNSPNRLALAGLVVYGFALVAGLAAATLSGFVATGLAREMNDAAPSAIDGWRMLFGFTGRLNQAFALVLVVASSVAIVLWSAAMLKARALARSAAIYGLVLGPVIIFAVLSGYLRLHVTGFGLVVIGQSLWFIVVGRQLYGRAQRASSIALPVALLAVLLVALGVHLAHAHMGAHGLGADKVELRSAETSLPLKPLQGRPTIGVFINSSGPYRFILDSGAATSVIDPALAKELKLEYYGDVRIGSPIHPEGTPAKIFRASHLVAGDLDLSGLKLVALSLPQSLLSDDDPPRGVLSPLLLQGYLVAVDFPRSVVVIKKGELPVADGKEIFEYEMGRTPRVPIQVGGKSLDVDLDLGASRGLTLPHSYIAELPLASTPVKTDPIRTVDASLPAVSASLNGTMTLGRYSFEHPEITFGDGMPNGNLGSALLNRFVITLDPASHRVRIAE